MGTPTEDQNKKRNDAFSEYMWMGSIEEFDNEAEKAIEEEQYIHACIEKLLDEEEQDTVYYNNHEGRLTRAPALNGSSHSQNNESHYSYGSYNQYNSYETGLKNGMENCSLDNKYQMNQQYHQTPSHHGSNNNHFSQQANQNGTYFYNYEQDYAQGYGQPNGYVANPNSLKLETTILLNPDAQEFVPGKPFDWSKHR